jgi:group I intron endonuclease
VSNNIIIYNYITTNLVNGKQYIGMHSTDNIDDGYLGSGKYLLSSIKKYGKENFKRELIRICETEEIAHNNEADLIKSYNTLTPNGYNISPKGGWGTVGCHSEETKLKISNSEKGKFVSDETKQKMSNSLKGKSSNMKGKKRNQEFILKLKKANKGKIPWIKDKHLSEDAKQRIRESKLGEKNPNFNKHPSKETIQKMRDSQRKRWELYRLNKHLKE